MDKKIIITPVDADSDEKDVFITVREFPIERMMLFASAGGIVKAEKFRKDLEKWSIPASIVKIKSGNPWEEYFTAVSDVIKEQEKDKVVINISSADRISQCALTNAAHVNGIKAFAVLDGRLMMLPIMKLSFSSMISPKKMTILKELHKNTCSNSLEELAKKTGMSLQLLSYHVKGTPKSEGLVQLELVEIKEEKGRIKACLSTMGSLFMRGYLRS